MELKKKLFVVIVTGLEARSADGFVVVKAGTKFLVEHDPAKWVEATSSKYHGYIRESALTFNSFEEAKSFAKKWKGDPWYCIPSGKFQIIQVKPRVLMVPSGFVPVAGGNGDNKERWFLAADITEETVAAVEAEVGMGRQAWDTIDPSELIAACVNVYLRSEE